MPTPARFRKAALSGFAVEFFSLYTTRVKSWATRLKQQHLTFSSPSYFCSPEKECSYARNSVPPTFLDLCHLSLRDGRKRSCKRLHASQTLLRAKSGP